MGEGGDREVRHGGRIRTPCSMSLELRKQAAKRLSSASVRLRDMFMVVGDVYGL